MVCTKLSVVYLHNAPATHKVHLGYGSITAALALEATLYHEASYKVMMIMMIVRKRITTVIIIMMMIMTRRKMMVMTMGFGPQG